jgi:SAM-dependent methyltransferase
MSDYNPGYDHSFYNDLENTALPSARIIIPMLRKWIPLQTAVDVGCGDGSWLSVVLETGGDQVLGLDGPWVDENQLKIPKAHFRRMRIDHSVDVAQNTSFDLAMSLEVAEHLPAERAPGFVDELCSLAPVVLFSAAIPGQGGHHHVNEQWPDYWAKLFARNRYLPVDALRPVIWDHPSVFWWYKQNCLIFASEEVIGNIPEFQERQTQAAPMSLVHPDLFSQAVRRAEPSFGRWLKQGGKAWKRSQQKRNARRV